MRPPPAAVAHALAASPACAAARATRALPAPAVSVARAAPAPRSKSSCRPARAHDLPSTLTRALTLTLTLTLNLTLTLTLTLLVGSACTLPQPRTWPQRSAANAAPDLAPAPATPTHPDAVARAVEIGHSVQARPILMRTIGRGLRKVLLIGGIHGDEREGHLAAAELPEAFVARDLGSRVTLFVVEDLNPDGSADDTRGNANRVDLNRNFPARNFGGAGGDALSQPEARVLHRLVLDLRPDLIIVLHSWRGRRFINFDGPAADLAARFSRLSGYPLVRSDEFEPTPGSLGSWIGRDLGMPILTLEFQRGSDPRQCWEDTREALLEVIAGGVEA